MKLQKCKCSHTSSFYGDRVAQPTLVLDFVWPTGISSQIGTKLRDWAVGQARAGCYSQVGLSSIDSKTKAQGGEGDLVL